MKKKSLCVFLSLLLASSVFAADLDVSQREFRLELLRALGIEGFNPDIDDDGDIKFKDGNITYYVSVDARWKDPFMIDFFTQIPYDDEYTNAVMQNCISLVGQFKTVKLFCGSIAYVYRSEIFCLSAEAFKTSFKAILTQMRDAQAEVASIVEAGIGDLNLATDKDQIFARAKALYASEDFDKSFAVFKLLGSAGYAPAYRYLGESYENGAGVIANTGKMIQYYEKAIEEGDYWSAYKLADYYYGKKEYGKAYNLFLKCASNENENKSNAMFKLGYMQEHGLGVAANREQAEQSYRKSVQYATRLECDARLALMSMGVPVENKSEFVEATKVMLMGISSPQELYNIGYEYENGQNKRFVSLPKAYAYYKAAADRGYEKAYVKMGDIYISKYYPFNDKAKSDKYYQKAFKIYSQKADRSGEACYELGNMYKNGLGVARDMDQAKFYFKKGAMANDRNASYEYGLICKADLEYPEAFAYFNQAAEKAHVLAMYELAKLYEEGLGTDMNRSKAIEWYRKCTECDSSILPEARKALRRLGSREDKI